VRGRVQARMVAPTQANANAVRDHFANGAAGRSHFGGTERAGAKAAGLRGILVRTGKFREDALAAADPKPDAVIDSVADLPGALDSGRT
jgi:hypothetical protein